MLAAQSTESLRSCEGFEVALGGGMLGVVDAVLYGESAELSGLSVRRRRFARGVRIIDASDIQGIDTRARRIDVRSTGLAVSF